MENRRGQIGDTIDWFVAFIIIFFLMLIFIAMASYLASTRDTAKTTVENIGPFKESENLRDLYFILESKTESGKTIKELIIDWRQYELDNSLKGMNIMDRNLKRTLEWNEAWSRKTEIAVMITDIMFKYKIENKGFFVSDPANIYEFSYGSSPVRERWVGSVCDSSASFDDSQGSSQNPYASCDPVEAIQRIYVGNDKIDVGVHSL